MRITIERSGGVGGIRRTQRLDETSLSPPEREHLRELVRRAGFFQLSASYPPPPHLADAFQYRVTVEDGAESHTVTATDGSIPPALEPIMTWAMRQKRPTPTP